MCETWTGSGEAEGRVGQDSETGELLSARCGEQGLSQPVGSALAGSADRSLNLPGLLWRQADRKDNRNPLLREPRPPHFGFHNFSHFCLRKYLTGIWTIVYKSLVSKVETRFCQKSARTSLARLASQGHPAVTGAGRERLAVKAESFQVATSERQVRSLKVEAIGDFARRKVIPRIRIAGQWLEKAGFKPGNRVELFIEQPGNISLRFVEEVKEAAL
jgi:hypothetical protein